MNMKYSFLLYTLQIFNIFIKNSNENNPSVRTNFVDEVYIDDQNVLSISVEKMFEEQPKRARKTRYFIIHRIIY
jgi:hypothetical protein